MIEATCGACGTVARIAEADVPVGAKFVTCASCKSRVPLPQGKAAGAKPPIPPAIPKAPPIPSVSTKPTVDLADLPAPKRSSALAGTEGASKPAPRSALDAAELPAPKSSGGKLSAPPSALDLDDLIAPDLPAPKGATDVGLADLPAPKAKASALADLPAPKAKASALADLPAPKAKVAALADLPAPKKSPAGLADLPAPKKGGSLDLDDLPAPRKGGALDLDDLPAPKLGADGTLGLSLDGDLDLPMPKPGLGDLPTPKPGANNDLPAPKGFFDDLPQPAKKPAGSIASPGSAADGQRGGSIDLPAPKGFFDDLPQPATGSKGPDLPAPKGFFDDLPQPATGSKGAADLPAPKGGGFFDDLPQPAKPAGKPAAGKPAAAAKPGSAGLFDDLEMPASGAGGPDEIALPVGDIDLGPVGNDAPLELDGGPSAGPDLDLGLPLGQDAAFTDLELATPTGRAEPSEPGSPIKIKTPAKGAKPATPIQINVKKEGPASLELDLADDPHAKHGGAPAVAAAAGAGGKGVKRAAQKSPEEEAAVRAKKQKRTRIALAGVLGVALLGSGGFYFYKKHTAEQARQDEIAEQLATARKQMSAADPKHWQRASSAASKVLELAPNHGPALGLAAEAALAGALDNGANYEARVRAGRKLTQDGLGAGKIGPELERAQALMAIAANQSDRAITMLDKLTKASPKDGWLQLYMGWAQLAKGDADAALKAFDAASASTPATKIPATYGVGRAKLSKADLEGAKAAFASVLEQSKDHIGAQVGLAATLPPQQSAQREADLLAILALPDIKTADTRAVVAAYDLVGDVARNTGRLDIARERYRKALALMGSDIPALVGLAAVELKDGKLQVASDLVVKALAADANSPQAQLLAAELDVVQGKLPDATGKLEKLAARKPPLPPLLAARMHLVKGKLLEAQGTPEDAVTEYTAGAKLAGELDLTPTMAAVTTLTDLAKKEADPAKAEDYKKRADELLSALAERAREDGELSLTLGTAYLQAGDAVKAQDFLRRAVAMREKDPEAKLQLAKALSALGRVDDAIAQLKDAQAIDPKRGDIALELARTYQNSGRDAEAMAAYDKLLAGENVPTVVRANAGRYFASRGARDKAAAQAAPILAVEPENAVGLYLKGEGLMLAKKWDEARIALTKASDIDETDAQFLDALGRAFEGSLAQSNDTKYIESARYAYERATKADPKMFHPHLGHGRMLVAAGKWEEAIKALTVASSLDKSHAEVMYQMGQAFYGVRGQSSAHKKTAADWLESSLKNKPELSLDQKADASYRLGQLYTDLNKAGSAANAMENATRLAEQVQQQTGKTPDWLVETYYDLGQLYEGLNNKSAQRRAWERYVDSKPKPSVRLKTAQQALATSLQRY